MKGKSKFTAHDALSIMATLNYLKSAPESHKKNIRDGLREKGFYISKYGHDLSPEEFDSLVQDGTITISEHKDFYESQKKRYFQETIKKLNAKLHR